MSQTKALRALKRFCLECQGQDIQAVRDCREENCPLWPFRASHKTSGLTPPPLEQNPLRAIRRQCMLCADNRREVRACNAKEACAIWSFRFGVLPSTYLAVKRRLSRNKMLSLIKK